MYFDEYLQHNNIHSSQVKYIKKHTVGHTLFDAVAFLIRSMLKLEK